MNTTFATDLWPILWLTLRLSASAVVLSAVVGIPLGAWLGLSRNRGTDFLRVIVQTGMALPPVVVGLVLYLLLSRTGPLGSLGWLFTFQAMLLAQVILALPFVVGITMNAVRAVPDELLPQLQSLGANRRQIRWTILREARSGLFLAISTAFGRSLSEVGAILIVGGNIQGETRALTTAIVLETSKGNLGFALTLGAVLMLLALLINLLILRWSRS